MSDLGFKTKQFDIVQTTIVITPQYTAKKR